MANVWYIGDYQKREVFGQTFDFQNGWSLPEANFSSGQLAILDDDSGFLLGQAVGPRTNPPPSGIATGSPGWAYYAALQDLYNSGVGMPFSRVMVVTGSESRPPVSFCIWMGGSVKPEHILDGDLWLKASNTDILPPVVPSGLVASIITATGFTLSWSATSDNVGVTGYRVYINGSVYATIPGLTQVISGLDPDSTYLATVSARDLEGNWSAQSSPLSVDTLETGSEVTHSIWANTYPFNPQVFAQAAPTTVATAFYTYGSGVTGWKVKGIRVWKGTGVTAAGNVDVGLWTPAANTAPNLAVAGVRTGTISALADGWNDFNFSSPVEVSAGQVFWLGYRMLANNFILVDGPIGEPFIRSVDDVNLVFADQTPDSGQTRNYIRVGSGASEAADWSRAYGIDVIMEATA